MQLTDFRRSLEAQVRDNQLPDALRVLLDKLPEGSENHRVVSALITRLNAANKERFRNTISTEEYQRRVDQVAADFFDLLGSLTEADFDAKTASGNSSSGKTAKQGTVLHRVPGVMPIQKPTRCTIRVAVEEDAILENIVLDEHVEIKSKVEISDVMSAELLDPEGGVFQINALNARTQLVRESGYTEWNFSVVPLREGVHQLLVKVSIMEVVPGFAEPIPRDVSVMETVTIVTEGAAPDSAGFKPSGQTFALHNPATQTPPGAGTGPGQTRGAETAPTAPAQQTATASEPQQSAPKRSLRALALFLGFLVLAPAATWALTPAETRDWWIASILEDSPEAYAAYIEEYNETNSPHLEKAYFRRAAATGRLADLRGYQTRFPEGKYRQAVTEKVASLELRAVDNLRQNPNRENIRQFVADFPESERLPEIKRAVETRQTNRQELLAEVEDAYVASVQAKPTETKVAAYLRDFPEQTRLEQVEAAARAQPEVFQKVQPALEEAYLKKMEQNPTQAQSEAFLNRFPQPVQREKLEQVLEKKPSLKKDVQQKMERIERQQKSQSEPSSSKISESPKPAENLKIEPTPSSTSRPRRSGLEMQRVQGGSFGMGSNEDDPDAKPAEKPVHLVSLPGFSIGKYEVTQADWRDIMGADADLYNRGCDECPVDRVSWDDIQLFLKKLNAKYPGKAYRLPSETEWEYAARGGINRVKTRQFKYAGSNDLRKVGWFAGNYKSGETLGSKKTTHPVGQLAPNELGLYDMSGNLWEWCQDIWHENYKNAPANGQAWVLPRTFSLRVLRGGAWVEGAEMMRVVERHHSDESVRSNIYGFRLAHD